MPASDSSMADRSAARFARSSARNERRLHPSTEHLHSRTEESYLILSGRGELLLNGVAHPVRAGSLALTGIGNTHGLRNTGDSDLDWLVVETLAPATDRALRGQSSEGAPMGGVVLKDLFGEGVVETAGVFTGPCNASSRSM